MISRSPADFMTDEERITDLRLKIARVARQMENLVKCYQCAESTDEKNFFARRIGMKQDLIDSYIRSLMLLEQ